MYMEFLILGVILLFVKLFPIGCIGLIQLCMTIALQWMELRQRKRNLRRTFERIQGYQFDKIKDEPDKALTEDTRPLTEDDIMR